MIFLGIEPSRRLSFHSKSVDRCANSTDSWDSWVIIEMID